LSCAGDGVRLTTTGSTIGEDSSVVAVENIVEERPGSRFVDLALRGILVKNAIEGECLVLDAFSVGHNTPGKLLDRVVFWRIEYPMESVVSSMSLGMESVEPLRNLQTSVIDHLYN